MLSTKILTDPRDDPIFRANMTAAIRHYFRSGLQVLRHGQRFCGGCGRLIPIADLQKLRQEPVFCQNCGRLLVFETDPRRPMLTTAFA